MKNSTLKHAFATKIAIIYFSFAMAYAPTTMAQKKGDPIKYLDHLPKNLKLTEKSPQKYLMTADYFNGDIFGNFINKTRVTGEYTRGFPDGTVKWNNVSFASGNTRDGAFENAIPQDYMENFTYKPSEKMVEATSFSDFPPNSFHAKNLVWDMMGLEAFAWPYFDSLQLNKIYRPQNINGEVQLAGEGFFENRDIQLEWVGISQMNGEVCALIEYRTFDNPLSIVTEQLKLKGRSHYWGTIWVSLEDKQIEHAVLYEDVVMDMTISGQNGKQLMNTTRSIVVEKLD